MVQVSKILYGQEEYAIRSPSFKNKVEQLVVKFNSVNARATQLKKDVDLLNKLFKRGD